MGLSAEMREALAARVRFYRELGIGELYRRPVGGSQMAELDVMAFQAGVEEEVISPSKSRVSLSNSELGPALGHPENKIEALKVIREEIGDCTRCALHTGRHTIVFADGSPDARLMFVGEGPGADEDAQGLPFVGRAGQLLNNMIVAMGLKREEVYIANIVKCRPPGNRTPEPEEANTCVQFLNKQIEVVRPEVIVALGATAATYLLGHRQPLAGLRGRVHGFRGTKLIVTYHPAFLLRDPRQKKEAWADLQIAMRELGLKREGPGTKDQGLGTKD
ncbi:MAG TPA: uracil-DNA glycosylase [Terracidiphilus sp.]|jgi:DNA polymerase|nr:uracil-DNA glycosylase [Terracidiphilus sp.]